MNQVQRYLFGKALRGLTIIVVGLVVVALLAQGLSQTDIIIDDGQSALTYFKIVALGAPRTLGLLLPLALFVASLWTLNNAHRDSELVVAQATGMTRWQVASPMIRLAVLTAIVHLALNLWVQPTAQSALREAFAKARTDLAASFIKPGQFTSAGDNLTFFAATVKDGQLTDILISDSRTGDAAADYVASHGEVLEVDGAPGLLLSNATRIQSESDAAGTLNVLEFEQYFFDLSPFVAVDTDLTRKEPDRLLHELFFIDETNLYEAIKRDAFKAEGHARLTSPLVNIVMVMLAILTILGGDFSRRGYVRRIVIAVAAAMFITLLQLTVQAQAASAAEVNIVQWLLPIGLTAYFAHRYLNARTVRRQRGKRSNRKLKVQPA